MLDQRIADELRALHDQWLGAGKLPSEEQLTAWYGAFRERFAPERLQSLDGPSLLKTMHEHGNTDSMVYWLEFKDDDEFPAIFAFGP